MLKERGCIPWLRDYFLLHPNFYLKATDFSPEQHDPNEPPGITAANRPLYWLGAYAREDFDPDLMHFFTSDAAPIRANVEVSEARVALADQPEEEASMADSQSRAVVVATTRHRHEHWEREREERHHERAFMEAEETTLPVESADLPRPSRTLKTYFTTSHVYSAWLTDAHRHAIRQLFDIYHQDFRPRRIADPGVMINAERFARFDPGILTAAVSATTYLPEQPPRSASTTARSSTHLPRNIKVAPMTYGGGLAVT